MKSSTDFEAVRRWFKEGCGGPPPEEGSSVSYHGAGAHASHPLGRLDSQQRWYCRICASSATEYRSDKMQSQCAGKPGCDSMAYKLK
eukprot:6416591-Pyramimonas_sp.AAC.1